MHLFAGIGGGLLADLILGHDPIIAVEWDGYACQVLRERAADGWFPELSVWEGDVRLFDPSEYAGQVDCIHEGFPCQDISVAGNQAGVGHETRSGLYREVLRIAGIVRPRYLFLENVAAILGNGLGTVLADLAAMGFSAEWGCIRASDCGAPHHRDRWFCLATHSDSIQWRTSGMGQDAWADGRNDVSGVCEVLADTDSALSQRNERTERGESERTDAIKSGWWDSESLMGRVANGIPNRAHRLKGLGNAQVPLQAAVAFKLLGGQ
jgi:DNA (cytosine-5)-methyltransferase 1